MFTTPLYARKPAAAASFYPSFTNQPLGFGALLLKSGATPTISAMRGGDSATTSFSFLPFGNGDGLWDHAGAVRWSTQGGGNGNVWATSATDHFDGGTWTAIGTSNYLVVGGAVARFINGKPVFQAQGGFVRTFSGPGTNTVMAVQCGQDIGGYGGYAPFFQIKASSGDSSGNALGAAANGLGVAYNSGGIMTTRGSVQTTGPAGQFASGTPWVVEIFDDGTNLVSMLNETPQASAACTSTLGTAGTIYAFSDAGGNGQMCAGAFLFWPGTALASDRKAAHSFCVANLGTP